jgi:hypothetical protein
VERRHLNLLGEGTQKEIWIKALYGEAKRIHHAKNSRRKFGTE